MKIGGRLQRIEFLLLLSIVLTVASIVITIFHVRKKREATELVIQTYNVIRLGNDVYTQLLEMENDRILFYVRGDTTVKKPFASARQKILNDLALLRTLVQLPEAVSLVNDKIEPLLSDMLNKDKIDSTYQRSTSVRHPISYQVDQRVMNQVQDAFKKLELIKSSALVARQENLDRIDDFSSAFLLISFGLIGITSITAWASLRSRQRDINKLVESLEEWNLSLEGKVEERTKEISSINQELLIINEEKDNFIGIVSHDLKSPITGIQNLAHLMKTQGASADQQEYLNLILESCSQIQFLIAEILDVNRIDQGLQTVLAKKISVSGLMGRLQKYFDVLARDKQITLHFRLPDTEVLCFTDESILYQVLSNLISNAIKFSKPESQVQVTVIQKSPDIIFEVTDNGPGIDPDDMSLLFKKFQKLKARPTKGESSTGLGLFIVNRFVHLLKGSIGVQSIPNQKTTFTVSIPQ